MPIKTNKTLLLVGEGYNEVAFLRFLKSNLVARSSGLTVTIKNAKGKGAKHVIEWTIRQMSNAQYDHVGVLFDTDTDWNQIVEKKAKSKKLILLKSEPCFEKMMLRLLNVQSENGTKALKKQFLEFVSDPSDFRSYEHKFPISYLIQNRHANEAINTLLTLFGSSTQ